MNTPDEEFKRLFKGANVFERDKVEPQLATFLREHPNCVPALRLRGHMLEYEVALEQSQNVYVDSFDPRLEIIRTSYESALQADPYCVAAAIDLGDYWNDFTKDPERAIEYYDRAILLLKSGQCTEDREVELRNAYKGKIQTLMAIDKDAAARCREEAMVECQGVDFEDLSISDSDP
jgi:hypothetical protein